MSYLLDGGGDGDGLAVVVAPGAGRAAAMCGSSGDRAAGRSRFAGRSRGEAAAVLAALAIGMAACLVVFGDAATPYGVSTDGAPGDLELYRAVVGRIHAGQGYYEALGGELRARDYGTRSVLNWRPPLHLWLIGRLADPSWARGALLAVAASAIVAAYRSTRADAGPSAAIAVATALAILFSLDLAPGAELFVESWVGPLILLAIGLGAVGRPIAGALAGLSALLLRELTLPFAAVAAWGAWRAGRRREAVLWVAGMTLFFVYLAAHAAQVQARITAADRAYPSGWLQLGGVRFLLGTFAAGTPLLPLPRPLTAIGFPLALLGLLGAPGELARRARPVAATYLALFSVVGKSFNVYWGLIDAPLLVLGVAWAPVTLGDLARALDFGRVSSDCGGLQTEGPAGHPGSL